MTSLAKDFMGTAIVVGNDKGGVGSTSLVACLAVLLQGKGAEVVMLDCGWRYPLQAWNERRSALGMTALPIETIWHGSVIDKSRHDYTLIDVGRSVESVEAMLRDTDVWLVPTAPSPFEIDAAIRMFSRWCATREGMPKQGVFAVLFTRVDQDEREAERAARRQLAEVCPGLVVLDHPIALNSAWVESSLGFGLSELTSPSACTAQADLDATWNELMGHISRSSARRSKHPVLDFRYREAV